MVKGLAVALLYTAVPASAAIKPGEAAPAYIVTTFDKAKTSSDQLRGQVVVINLWATWCGPCKRELPLLDAYNRAHAGQGLRIFAVATEDSVPDSFLRPLSAVLSFPLAHRVSSGKFAVLKGVPTNYVIDRRGVVRYAQAAAFDQETLDAVIGPLLAEPVPPAP
jgi:cytochrome c biogenesis protein CcmG/thiol:disulfide interchange protein DsbE